MQGVLRFWLERGASGYRVDAIDRLLKDAQLRDDPPASEPFGLPLRPDEAALALSMSRNAPDTGEALAKIRAATDDAFLVGEVYLPAARWQPYLESLDAAFAFELLHADWDAATLHRAIDASARVPGRAAWVMSNHDFGRLPTRFGAENARAAALLLLTLPGPAFLYQGDEIGQRDGPPGESRFDRAGRDGFRHPMQWEPGPDGGFTTGEPWLPVIDPGAHNVHDQRDDPGSMLTLVRDLIALRRQLSPEFELLDAEPGLLAFRRGEHLVAINTTAERLPARGAGAALLETEPGALRDGTLAPHAGVVAEVRFSAPIRAGFRPPQRGGRISPEPRTMNSVGTITRCRGPGSPSRRAKSTSPAARPSATGSWATTVMRGSTASAIGTSSIPTSATSWWRPSAWSACTAPTVTRFWLVRRAVGEPGAPSSSNVAALLTSASASPMRTSVSS